MKNVLALMMFMAIAMFSSAQKVDFKDDIITVDGKQIAKLKETKEGVLGMGGDYEIQSMDGQKLIVAEFNDGGYKTDPNNTADAYYEITFVSVNKMGVFYISKMGPKKNLAKMIGNSGVIVNGSLDEKKVDELLAKKGLSPIKFVNYEIVGRNTAWPVTINADYTIDQQKIIGSIKEVTKNFKYQYLLPSGTVIATVSFKDGDNSQTFYVETYKDAVKQTVSLPTNDRIIASSEGNFQALKRITKWMVEKGYL